MTERRQAVVVGASYGGLIAGALLAEAGIDTLLVDEFDLVGQPGGAVPYNGYWKTGIIGIRAGRVTV
jgi:2-polyprenyl-6-methoxyphenol hydroxylase-like FAD-dependent oxidoreductase